MKSSSHTLEGIAYALYARFARIWRSRFFLFGLGSRMGIPNVGERIAPQACEFASANILVIRPDVFGDVLLSIPFLLALKRRLPDARVTLAVSRPWTKFVGALQIVDEVIEYPLDSDRWRAASNVFRAAAFGRNVLKKRKFDVVLNPRWDADFHDAHLVAFFSHAPHRITFFEKATSWKTAANRGRDVFYTHIVEDTGVRHESARSLYFLQALGLGPSALDAEADLVSIRNKVQPMDLDAKFLEKGYPLIGVFPGVQDSVKQWLVENFIEAAKQIFVSRSVRFLVFGTEKESSQCAQFTRELSEFALNLSGKTGLMELAGYIRQCSAVISCDSGGAHLAGILEVPVAVIFRHPHGGDPESQLSPERFRPLGKDVCVLQPGVDNPLSVAPKQVSDAILHFIDRKD